MILFTSITMFFGTNNIMQNIPQLKSECGILPVPQNIVINLNNVMTLKLVW